MNGAFDRVGLRRVVPPAAPGDVRAIPPPDLEPNAAAAAACMCGGEVPVRRIFASDMLDGTLISGDIRSGDHADDDAPGVGETAVLCVRLLAVGDANLLLGMGWLWLLV